MVTPGHFIALAVILFVIGAVGVLVRRNAIVVFMCVELMLDAVNLTLVTFSRINGTLDGQIMAFFVMVVAAAEVVVGLAIIMSIFRTRRSSSATAITCAMSNQTRMKSNSNRITTTAASMKWTAGIGEMDCLSMRS